MKKRIAFALVLSVVVGLSACKAANRTDTEEPTESTAAVTTEATVVTTEASATPTEAPTTTVTDAPTDTTAETASQAPTEVTTAPTETPTEASTQAPTEAPHSEFYVPDMSVDQIIAYFNEVALGMENSGGDGNAALVEKWDRPINYRIEGMPNRQDAQTLNELTKQLNAIEGFPGIQAAKALEQNLTIYFLKDADFQIQFGHVLGDKTADGVVQIWHNDSNGSCSGRIGYRQEASQEVRNAVIPEKLVDLLGISRVRMQTEIPEDPDDEPIVKLSDLDWAVIKLLYNPRIHNGMNADECEMIIRELYY